MAEDVLQIRGAREHNLTGVDVDLPRGDLVVVTGPSGSGKSSLAFDTVFAEGQRRYMESLSAYARQFLGQMEKPDVDHIEGLSPAISIDQKARGHNPRSTVGTVTEIYDYLRLLFANLGTPHCPECGQPVAEQSPQQIAEQVLELEEGTKFQVLAPVVRDRKGTYEQLFEDLLADGYTRVRVNGEMGRTDDEWDLERYETHTIEVVVDRLKAGHAERPRIVEAVETALDLAEGVLVLWTEDGERVFSEALACTDCGINIPEVTHRSFSFNSPQGACEACSGLGTTMEVDPERVVTDPAEPVGEGAIHGSATRGTWVMREIENLGNHLGFSLDDPFEELGEAEQHALLYGTDEAFEQVYDSSSSSSRWETYASFEGLIPQLERRYTQTDSDRVRNRISDLMADRPCPDCNGRRLKDYSRAVTLRGRNVQELCEMPVERLVPWFEDLEGDFSGREQAVAGRLIKEVRSRLSFMHEVGLGYLTLARASETLSGGESQRIRLATQIGSGLVGVLYVLDEPTIGLHHRDNMRLVESLKGLRDLGNTLLVVEHDKPVIREADHVVDLGPGAGEQGGEVVAQGTPGEVAQADTLTGRALRGDLEVPVPDERRPADGDQLTVKGARLHNLDDLDVDLPLGAFTAVTGVSGSGKSTLVHEILYKALAREVHGASDVPGEHDGLEGTEAVEKAILVDQSPIGRTPRSNPATYTKVFTPIRELFASTPLAKQRGYEKGRFSFNVKGGRCEACSGKGRKQVDMHFLADVYVPCEECEGARYNDETLEVEYNGQTIEDVLDMTVDEALDVFEDIPKIRRKLGTLSDVGLGYLRLGQPAPTLSGGEAQRIKLSRELSKRQTGDTVYVLDEPTTGLHVDDIRKLLDVLHRLVDQGNTVVIIEHNLDVVKTADHIVDLGPEGGERGGELVAEGTPEEVVLAGTHTGEALEEVLDKERVAEAAPEAR
jgi:excinuclease ABC subunit A